ncbi:MAG: hypothetical protein H6741_21420 [Alphaproteobacteria bacterium]|nr:hypothetical protein [Alphaproteobacteria bacterium]
MPSRCTLYAVLAALAFSVAGCQPDPEPLDRIERLERRHADRAEELRRKRKKAPPKPRPPQPRLPPAWDALMASGCDVEGLVHHQVVAAALLGYPAAARGAPVEEPALEALFASDGGWFAPDPSISVALPPDVEACLVRLEVRQLELALAMPISGTFLEAQLSSPRIFGGLWRSSPGTDPVVLEDEDRMAWTSLHGCAWERAECLLEGVVCERDVEAFDCFLSGDALPLVLGERWRSGGAAEVLAEREAQKDWSVEWDTLVYGDATEPDCLRCQPAGVGDVLSPPPRALEALFDGRPETAACWPAGAARFEVEVEQPMPLGGVAFLGGHFASKASLRAHGRAKRLAVAVDGGPASTSLIADPAASPRSLEELRSSPLRPHRLLEEGQTIQVEVTEVYPGALGDVCISDLQVFVLLAEQE